MYFICFLMCLIIINWFNKLVYILYVLIDLIISVFDLEMILIEMDLIF